MLTLIFMTHGKRPESGKDGLTELGRRQVFSTAQKLNNQLKLQLDSVLHAPDRRSLESADIIQKVFGGLHGEVPVRESPLLAEGVKGKFTQKGLAEIDPSNDTVICISHSEAISTQFDLLHGARDLGHGVALIMTFSEASWKDVRYDTLPERFQVVSPNLD